MATKKRKENPYALRGKYPAFITESTGAKWSIIRVTAKKGYGLVWYEPNGEMHDAWHEVYREKSAALNVLYYLASLIIQEGRKVTWVNLV